MIVTAAELIEVELGAADRARLARQANQIVTVEWFGRRIAARFEQDHAAAIFRARYADFLASGPVELESCAAFSENGEPLFWTEPGAAYRYPARIAAAHVVAFLADAATQRAFFDVNAELLSFHAAAVAVGDRAAAISAISTGGKSTTAIACARRGMALFSDERCVLKDGRVNAFPRAMNLRQHGDPTAGRRGSSRAEAVEVGRLAGEEYFLANALHTHAHLLLDDMRTEEARLALAEARALFGPRPSAVDLGFVLVEEARCELQAARPEEAATAARQAIELLGDQSAPGELGEAYLVLARVYDERGDIDRADRAYTSAIASLRRQNGWHRELARAYRWYGKFLRRAGRTEAAIELLEQAADLSLPVSGDE